MCYVVSDRSATELAELLTLTGRGWDNEPGIILSGDDTSPANPPGITTATAEYPSRNLNEMAGDEFTNIGLAALAMLCEWHGFAPSLVADAEQDSTLFVNLGHLMMQVEVPTLQSEFNGRFGKEWEELFDQKYRDSHRHRCLVFPRSLRASQ